MCNRARLSVEPKTIHTRFGTDWLVPRPMDNRFDPRELRPKGGAYALRQEGNRLGLEVGNDVRMTLSGVINCVHGIGNLRTHGGDAHGRERGFARQIGARIARLAIHTASAAALFLIETWQTRHPSVGLKRRD